MCLLVVLKLKVIKADKLQIMNWYLVKLVFSIESGPEAQFDEQLRLIKAGNTNDAYFKARNIGRQEEVAFSNASHTLVKWRFIDVPEVNQVGELKDGMELYSNTIESEDREGYIHAVRKKGMAIQSRELLVV